MFSRKLSVSFLIIVLGFTSHGLVSAKSYVLESPDEDLAVRVYTGKQLQWEVAYKKSIVVERSLIGMTTGDGVAIGKYPKVVGEKRISIDKNIRPVIAQKSSIVRDNYSELRLDFSGDYSLEVRAYNDGVAYRFLTNFGKEVMIQEETMELNLPEGARTLFPEEETMISHFERLYIEEKVSDLSAERFASLPVYFETDKGTHIVFTEADLYQYPGLFLSGSGGNGLRAAFPGYVTSATPKKGSEDRNEDIESADYIAVTEGTRAFPWRLAVISDDAGDLVESQLVFLLSRENQIEDTGWIKPGKIAWDWYNANNIYGVDFESGINTETYKYYIDFASEYNLDYVILDEGWTKSTTEIKSSNPDINVPELVAYGKEKGVGIILWSLWKPMDKDYKNILALYASWGVVGVKIDFMQRADQYMVEYYEKIAKEAAKHKLLVDYHGAFKPAGLRRAFPNVISYEGVKGNENNKWSQDITPEHNVTLPFIRMVAGPMDYTPGSMVNTQLGNHRISHFRPMSLGTRVHQVAMYAVYESALQMLCENPSTYYREHETTEFISRFPTVWDETRVLQAKVGDYIAVARRSGKTWYVGAMTDWSARELEIDFSFLGRGSYKIDYMADGVNADKYAQDYVRKTGKVKRSSKLKVKLAPGGGWAAIITP